METADRESSQTLARSPFLGLTGWLLVAMLVLVLGLLAFFWLADEMAEGDTQAMDLKVLRSLRRADEISQPIGPVWLTRVFDDLTALGGTAVLTFVTVAVCLYLLLVGRRWRSLLVAGTIIGGGVLVVLLKGLYDRPRPDAVFRLIEVSSQSFPSGHAMMASVVYLTMGVLLTHQVSTAGQKVFLIVTALVLAVLVGLSRIWLGVHYPTDVLAGWAGGLVWALACHLLAWRIDRMLGGR